ncbi:MAG: hypothetical protein KAT68_05830 [Bacteroidales bacterium]|nr:hypothetical protein [Bacteroidales bacterium]
MKGKIKYSELQNELKIQQDILDALKDEEKVAFYNSMNNSEKKIKNQKITKNVFSISLILIILCVSSWYINDKYFSIKTNDEIFAEYFVFEKPNVITRNGSDVKNKLAHGLIEFDLENYEKAFNILSEVNNADTNNFPSAFYLSILHLEKENYHKATEILENIEDCSQSFYCEKIKLNLALCYIKIGVIDKAKSILEQISSDENNYYNQEAKEILTEIEKRNSY